VGCFCVQLVVLLVPCGNQRWCSRSSLPLNWHTWCVCVCTASGMSDLVRRLLCVWPKGLHDEGVRDCHIGCA